MLASRLLRGRKLSSNGARFPPVVAYGRNFLAADELDVLPPGSAIEQMLADYQVMRIKYCVSEKHYGETQPLTGNATRNKSR